MVKSLQDMGAEVRLALEEKLRIRGRDLAAQIRKAGRLLPRGVRSDARFLAEALAKAESPKLSRQIDMGRAHQAHRNVIYYLNTVDLAKQRREAALNMVASIAFVLLATGVLLLFVLWARGFI